jgi:hypothetical protein
MYDWIADNYKVLSVCASLASVSVWLVYAQLLYLGFRRQRSPRLIINRGRNKDINALCLISNMSAESVFIEYIIAELETSSGTITLDVTDFELEYLESGNSGDGQSDQAAGNQRPLNASENTRQGPIPPGGFFHIGTFNELIQRIARNEVMTTREDTPECYSKSHGESHGEKNLQDKLELNCLTLRLIGIYGPEAMPIGAERRFDLKYDGDYLALTPGSWDTKQLATLRQRYKLSKDLEKMNAANFSCLATKIE